MQVAAREGAGGERRPGRRYIAARTYIGHEGREDGRVEAGVDLAAEHGRGDVEAAADLALREAVYKLREIVCQLPSVA